MRRMAHAPQGFPTDKVTKTVVRGQLNPEELDLIRGILTLEQNELDKDEMAEVIAATAEGITVEAASILVSSWYDAGKNKVEWEASKLNHWIMNVLATKMSMNFDETIYDENGAYKSMPKEGKMSRESMIASVIVASEVTNESERQIRTTLKYQAKAISKVFGGTWIPGARGISAIKHTDDKTVKATFMSLSDDMVNVLVGFYLSYDYGSDTYSFQAFKSDAGKEKLGRKSSDFYNDDLTDVSKLAYLFETVK